MKLISTGAFRRTRPARPHVPVKRKKSKWYMEQSTNVTSSSATFKSFYRHTKGKSRKHPPPAYKLANRIKESHLSPIYSVQFNSVDPRQKDMFATAGGNRVSVYRALPEGPIQLIQCFEADGEDAAKALMYTCAWCMDLTDGSPLLAFAGSQGRIHVVNCHTRKAYRTLSGHGSAVNEIRCHPTQTWLLLSVSKDMSARLWNMKTGICIAVFAGANGHRDEVLCCAFHSSGEKFITGGMDHAIKIWDLIALQELIALSFDYNPASGGRSRPFPTKYVQEPSFHTTRVHVNYVDSIQFLGDFVLSKSVGPRIVLWALQEDTPRKTVVRIQEYLFYACDIWYIRFNISNSQTYMGVGNKTGSCFVWNLLASPAQQPMRLSHPHCTQAVRQCVFNHDGTIMLAVCDNATLWRWEAPSIPDTLSLLQSSSDEGELTVSEGATEAVKRPCGEADGDDTAQDRRELLRDNKATHTNTTTDAAVVAAAASAAAAAAAAAATAAVAALPQKRQFSESSASSES